jgi:hypothetical protein
VISEVSGGKTHTKQIEMGHIDIHSRFVCTELATYTILLLTDESSNHGEKGCVIYFGAGGETVCVTLTRK